MNRRSIFLFPALASLLLGAWTPALAASDPRIPINALNTPGDAGSVFRITQPGSYYLEGNLVGEPGKHGIQVEASQVTLDLMGFSLLGGNGSSSALFAQGVPLSGVTIRRGFIRDWGQDGISFAERADVRVEDVTVAEVGRYGILVGNRAAVERCTVTAATEAGIVTREASRVVGCTVSLFGAQSGIQVGGRSQVVDCSVESGASIGIFLFGNGASAIDCTVFGVLEGIRSAGPATVAGCRIAGTHFAGVWISSGTVRDTSASDCGSYGIRVGGGSQVLRNSVVAVGLDGIYVESGARVEENDVRGSGSAGIRVFGTGSFLVKNTLTANGASLVFPNSGNFAGPLVSTNSVNGRSDPWANLVAN